MHGFFLMARSESAFCSSLLLFLFSSFHDLAHASLTSDAAALLAFKSSAAASTSALASWSSSAVADICTSWEGVRCSNGSSQRVTWIRLPGKALRGPIPAGTLGKLDALGTLSLRSNKLSGSLPADLATCAGLEKLNLQRNNFTGPLPSNFSAWPLLTQLDLSSNGFNGSIPSSVGSLNRLKSLYLQDNSLSGSIPAMDRAPLVNFSVAGNRLSGEIPPSLASFSKESFEGNQGLCGGPLGVECRAAAAAPSTGTPEMGTSNRKIAAGEVVGIVFGCIAAVLLAMLVIFIVLHKKRFTRKKKKEIASKTELESMQRDKDSTEGPPSSARSSAYAAVKEQEVAASGLVKVGGAEGDTFELDDLLRASAEVLGKGSVGTTYRAMLADGSVLAVKRMRDVGSLREEFRSRMEALARLRHPNLVALRAFYFAKQEKLIVLDFMPNGSLATLLHGDKDSARGKLDWEARLAIARGVGKGLAHLHAQGEVHADIKATNVLLNADNQACLSDYGLLPLISRTSSSAAYAAPELADVRHAGPSADVYSLGVLLLELLTGKPAELHLPRWVRSVFHDQWTADVFDAQLLEASHISREEMTQLLQTALLCASPSPDRRPAIADVVASIENLRKKPPAHVGDEASAAAAAYHNYPGRFLEISSDV